MLYLVSLYCDENPVTVLTHCSIMSSSGVVVVGIGVVVRVVVVTAVKVKDVVSTEVLYVFVKKQSLI